MLKIGYFADGPWAHQSLIKLLNNPRIKIVFICARFNRPDEILRGIAHENSIDFLVIPDINAPEFYENIKGYACDLLVSMSFNQIFKSRILELPIQGVLNCHAGMLPFYRGRNILNWALINDEKFYGITVHYVDEGIDTGDIIYQKSLPISESDNYSTLLNTAYYECAEALSEAIKMILTGTVKRIRQMDIDPVGQYCTARKKGDENINWNQKSRNLFNFIRALCDPGPMARTFNLESEIKINKAEMVVGARPYIGIPGSVVGIDGDFFYVKTLDTCLRITEWISDKKVRIGDRLT